jgi:hypothetical protein
MDGIDNDCNGVVDDVPPARVHPRALVFGPTYVFNDAKSDIAAVTTVLDQAGVPYDLTNAAWAAESVNFSQYSLLIVPGYLESISLDNTLRAAMETFVSGGGIVFVMKPLGGLHGTSALEFAGLRNARRAKSATYLHFLDNKAAALASINSPEEQNIPLSQDPNQRPVDVWTFEVEEGTDVLAEALAGPGTVPLGAVATRRPLGRGAIYAFGHNLSTFDASRCYVNCFEPSGDVLRLILRDALREGAQGHVVLKHPMAGAVESTLVLTHDVDTLDAYTEGPWGEPGALQMGAMETRNGVRATYNFATDYLTGTFDPKVVERLCGEGFCSAGAHSARLLRSFGRLPRGTCRETRETYGAKVPPTLCGEVRVSLEVLAKLVQARPRAWRSPYLASHPQLFDVLADSGVAFDSSFGVGDLKYNLPVDTAKTAKLQHLFHRHSLLEFPIAGEDGKRVSVDERKEMQARNLAWFADAWEYMMLRNAENQSITTLLVRPARGEVADDDNIKLKVAAVEHLIRVARAHGIAVDSLVHFGDFWRARSKVIFDAGYDSATGYRGFFQVGDEAIENLTFELGDVIESFDCPTCGTVEISGKRVVMRDRLAPGTRATFSALPRGTPP